MTTGTRRGLRFAFVWSVSVVACTAAACTSLIGAEDRYYADDASSSERDATAPGSDSSKRPSDAAQDERLSEAGETDTGGGSDANDAGVTSDASDANVVQNAGFELGIVAGNCGIGWNAEPNASLSGSPMAHTGDASCRVCNPTANNGYLSMDLPAAAAGANIVSSVWLALEPDAGASMTALALAVCDAGNCAVSYMAGMPAPFPVWTQLLGEQIVVQPEAGPAQVQLQVRVHTGCVLVDDVDVVYQ